MDGYKSTIRHLPGLIVEVIMKKGIRIKSISWLQNMGTYQGTSPVHNINRQGRVNKEEKQV
jgi:hypothetical protein